MLLSPVTLLLAALLLCAAGALAHRRWLRGIGVALLLAALASMTPLVANALVGALEARAVAAPGDCEDLEAVVFLSGGLQRAPRGGGDVAALTPDTVARVLGLAERGAGQGLPLVVSGGGPYSVAESDVIASLMHRLGIAGDAVQLESSSLTTWDSAASVRRLLPRSTTRIALASSALHLPRAMLAFRAQGFTVCPWPLRSRYLPPELPWSLLPQSSALSKTEAAWHELAGLLWYRVRLGLGAAG